MREREPITVIEVEGMISPEQAEQIRRQFAERVDDRPMLITGPGMRLYRVPDLRLVRVALLASLVASLLSVAAILLAVLT